MKKAMLILPIALTLGACSTWKTTEVVSSDQYPKWMAECDKTDTTGLIFKDKIIYACGQETSRDKTEAYELAKAYAMRSFAAMKDSSVDGSTDISLNSGTRTSTINTNHIISRVSVSQGEVDKEATIQIAGTSQYRSYVRMKWIINQ